MIRSVLQVAISNLSILFDPLLPFWKFLTNYKIQVFHEKLTVIQFIRNSLLLRNHNNYNLVRKGAPVEPIQYLDTVCPQNSF